MRFTHHRPHAPGGSSVPGRFFVVGLAGAAVALVAALVPLSIQAAVAPADYEIVRIELGIPYAYEVETLTALGIDIDWVGDGWARAYVFHDQFPLLDEYGFSYSVLPNQAMIQAQLDKGLDSRYQYHTHETLTSELQQIAADHPAICRLMNIGYSVEGRELWMMLITDNPDTQEDEPEFKYIHTMHGDETIAQEMAMFFINHLVDSYGVDSTVTHLVDNIELYVMPSMNPDGVYHIRRYNAHDVDLNRHFPDIDEPNSSGGKEPECAAVMEFTFERDFVLSANFHSGALVVNYPWDHCRGGDGCHAPREPMIIEWSEEYSRYNLPMWNGGFYHGITNGGDWYVIHGGMQDWSYWFERCMEVTVELSNVKRPPAEEIGEFWDDNRQSMLAYMTCCLRGIRGIVTDDYSGAPLYAEIVMDGVPDYVCVTDPDVGDYQYMIDAGMYNITVSSPGYISEYITGIAVGTGEATRVDVELREKGSAVEDVIVAGADSDFSLLQNNPNPFATSTAIEFEAPIGEGADLAVYGVGGRRVRTLAAGRSAGGRRTVIWDGLDNRGDPAPPGLYFCRLNAGTRSTARKLVLLP